MNYVTENSSTNVKGLRQAQLGAVFFRLQDYFWKNYVKILERPFRLRQEKHVQHRAVSVWQAQVEARRTIQFAADSIDLSGDEAAEETGDWFTSRKMCVFRNQSNFMELREEAECIVFCEFHDDMGKIT